MYQISYNMSRKERYKQLISEITNAKNALCAAGTEKDVYKALRIWQSSSKCMITMICSWTSLNGFRKFRKLSMLSRCVIRLVLSWLACSTNCLQKPTVSLMRKTRKSLATSSRLSSTSWLSTPMKSPRSLISAKSLTN